MIKIIDKKTLQIGFHETKDFFFDIEFKDLIEASEFISENGYFENKYQKICLEISSLLLRDMILDLKEHDFNNYCYFSLYFHNIINSSRSFDQEYPELDINISKINHINFALTIYTNEINPHTLLFGKELNKIIYSPNLKDMDLEKIDNFINLLDFNRAKLILDRFKYDCLCEDNEYSNLIFFMKRLNNKFSIYQEKIKK